MSSGSWFGFSARVETIFQYLIPSTEERIPVTWMNAHYAFAYMAPVGIMTYLVRRRDTRFLRLALLPLVIVMVLRCTFGYANVTRPETLLMNWLRGLAGCSAIALCLDCALSDTSRLKVGETPQCLPPMFYDPRDYPEAPQSSAWPTWLVSSSEVQLTFRGIGWNYGQGVYIPSEHRNLQRGPFLRSNFGTYVKGYLAIDAVQAFFKYTPGLGAPYGTSMWNLALPPLQRYFFALCIHLMCGVVIQLGLEMNYSLATMVGVGILGQAPSMWPPVYGNPWKADSIHDFWAKQWHQILRRVFMVLGGIPGQWFAGRAGAVMGTFIASGLYHEIGYSLVGRGLDHRVTLFFALQGMAILLEKSYSRFTGRRVGGWCGRIWTYFWILIMGQMCTDSWLSRGLGHAIFIPPVISPIEQIIIPLAGTLVS